MNLAELHRRADARHTLSPEQIEALRKRTAEAIDRAHRDAIRHGADRFRLKIAEAAQWLRLGAPGLALEVLEQILSEYEKQEAAQYVQRHD